MICNNLKLDLVNINAYTKFGEILSFCSQDIERKQNYDGPNDGQMDRQPKSSIKSSKSFIYQSLKCFTKTCGWYRYLIVRFYRIFTRLWNRNYCCQSPIFWKLTNCRGFSTILY